jgi:hypothetical protein
MKVKNRGYERKLKTEAGSIAKVKTQVKTGWVPQVSRLRPGIPLVKARSIRLVMIHPTRMDKHPPLLTRAIETITRPLPILHPLRQPTFHRIPMHIVQLLQPLITRVNIKVVISSLPEVPLLAPSRHRQLQRLPANIQRGNARFTHQQMNMLRHNHIPHYLKLIPAPNTIQPILKQISSSRHTQIPLSSIATKSYKMKVSLVLISLETDNHPAMLRRLPGILTV